ncbi:hypothetical protein B0181_04645 [Moraxella caviae]|uniref:Uncharacterized protein n=1 Tax=Moraxella caviae TaxID=34060 RepID=A0A1T0A4J3_9GAMM|nr:hypothetical protein [Moraxella caviae]OOR90610.1 hypothetical protein B0181_04645 [Moraxella caviae]STZ13514.1 Uncharacterised protein [Moraxella caviae]STZ13720.1 Uncharacterised protein [Moraxella caviae]
MIDISQINLEQLTIDELNRMKMILDMKKVQQDIELTRQTVEETRAAVNKMQAETEKARKETSWFPWVQILTLLATLVTGLLTGGVAMYFLTKLMPV